MGRPWWTKEYWEKMDWRQERRMRTICPFCGSDRTYYNKKYKTWKCLKCEKSFVVEDLRPTKDSIRARKTSKPKDEFVEHWERQGKRLRKYKPSKAKPISFGNMGRALGTFWRNLKKPLILIAVLATTTIVITTVCLSISGNVKLTTSIIFSIIGIGILVWGLNSLSQRRPSFARTFMVLLISGLFIISSGAYLGIKSPIDIRDGIISAFSTEEGQFRTTVDVFIERTELKVIEIASTDEKLHEEPGEEPTGQLEKTSHVYINGGILVGADGHRITLHNNPDAKNPSWEELKAFLAEDETDKHPYDFQTFVCADFAEMLHNNAEAASIKAAYVTVELGSCSYFPMGGGHCLNAFETTDRGLIYIDCTSPIESYGSNADKAVEVEVGKQYIPRSIFPDPGWSVMWGNMGIVAEIEIIQW